MMLIDNPSLLWFNRYGIGFVYCSLNSIFKINRN